MPTPRDLVEAQAFARRRVVTAFVSGRPGGREVQPARAGRGVAAGVVLSLVLLAAGGVGRALGGGSAEDWARVGLVLSEESGAAYVITDPGRDPAVHPVANVTSARLLLGPDLDPRTAPQASLDAQRQGAELGIRGAPAVLPPGGALVGTGWTACAAPGRGLQLSILARPRARVLPASALVVRVRGEAAVELLAPATPSSGARATARFRLPSSPAVRDRFLRAVGLPETSAAVVLPRELVDLFPRGAPLRAGSFGVPGAGGPVAYGGAALRGRSVGDVVSAAGDSFLLTPDGPMTLDPVAAALAHALRGTEPAAVEVATIGATRERTYPDAWPDALPRPATGEPCARLSSSAGAPPTVLLAGEPSEPATAADVPAGRVAVRVEPGHGALVTADGIGPDPEGGGAAVFLVDATGTRHALADDRARSDLGYADDPPTAVPRAWLALLRCGATLSREAAGSAAPGSRPTGDPGPREEGCA